MGNPVHSRWGSPLEQYVLYYDKAFLRGHINLEEDIKSSARKCIQNIVTISEEDDESKVNLLAKQITLAMLHSVLLVLLSTDGIILLSQPGLICGCIKIMKTVKVDGAISPFSYEYGYLCFNIAKMALGICLVEKFHRENISTLLQRIFTEHQTKDNASILTEHLSKLYLDEPKGAPHEWRCDWIFGWSDPPAHGGHSGVIIAESDALDLMDVLWDDRKAFLKSLSLTYTPGSSIIVFLIWQCMIRKGLKGTPDPLSTIPGLGLFLDLLWRSSLVATPPDYGFIFPMALAAIYQIGKLARSAVDVEDSHIIINRYVKGIQPAENTDIFHEVAPLVYHNLLRFVVYNILPGTESLFPAFIRSTIGRAWEMILWEEWDFMPPIGTIAGCFEDLSLFLRFHVPKLPSQSPVMQAILQEVVDNDLLGLVGFSIHRLYPNKEPSTSGVYKDLNSCLEFRDSVRSIIVALTRVWTTSTSSPYFIEYTAEWVKHVQYNDILLQMTRQDNAAGWSAQVTMLKSAWTPADDFPAVIHDARTPRGPAILSYAVLRAQLHPSRSITVAYDAKC
ncbi:unnamed protein product, partial [Rhizoctonia solani]